jgi:hypothetical protein
LISVWPGTAVAHGSAVLNANPHRTIESDGVYEVIGMTSFDKPTDLGAYFDGPGFVIGARQGAGGVELMMWRAKPWLLWAA